MYLRIRYLGCGVTVTLQILVLPLGVRVPPSQLRAVPSSNG